MYLYLKMSIYAECLSVYIYVQALKPSACGLSFICNKFQFCSVQFCSAEMGRWGNFAFNVNNPEIC